MVSSGVLVRELQLFLSLCPLILVERAVILKVLDKSVWIMKQQCGRWSGVEWSGVEWSAENKEIIVQKVHMFKKS